MAVILITTLIHAPIERVFDLCRSIDAHQHSTATTSEVAVGGTTSGLIGLGEEVEWEAYHFGVKQRLTSRISALSRPNHFQDVMIKGAFSFMKHDHYFRKVGDDTELKDVFEFKAPLGVLGRIAEKLFLTRYMRNFLITRNQILKHVAETDEWKKFLISGETV
jgi:ligand-binding SRPBCC domain-containing protein